MSAQRKVLCWALGLPLTAAGGDTMTWVLLRSHLSPAAAVGVFLAASVVAMLGIALIAATDGPS